MMSELKEAQELVRDMTITPASTATTMSTSSTPVGYGHGNVHGNGNGTGNNAKAPKGNFDNHHYKICAWTAGATQTKPAPPPTSGASVASASSHDTSTSASASTSVALGMSTRIGMRVNETPSPNPPELSPHAYANGNGNGNGNPGPPSHLPDHMSSAARKSFGTSLYQSRLTNSQSADAVEAVLAASCTAMSFDIAEVWLRTGPKTHQLINSHLRHTTLDETQRDALVEVYYGDSASDRTHRLSPALCKKAKEDNDVVWVTAQTESGAKALKCSLNGVLTAVAVPVCHEDSNSNMTVIYFSVKRATMRPEAIEFLVHMSLAAAVAGVNDFAEDDANKRKIRAGIGIGIGIGAQSQRPPQGHGHGANNASGIQYPYGSNGVSAPAGGIHKSSTSGRSPPSYKSRGESIARPSSASMSMAPPSKSLHVERHSFHTTNHNILLTPDHKHDAMETSRGIRPIPSDDRSVTSVTGARLDLTWSDLRNIEYLTDGGNNWIHTAIMNMKPIVIKQLKPEVQDVAVAINEIEEELKIHSLLDHQNIVKLFGAGFATNKSRFLVMERLDGGTLTQQLGYDTRIRDRRRRFWKKQKMPYVKVLDVAMQLAEAMDYCQRKAVPGSMVLHRDLKPDNIGLTLGGVVKLIDFGLARIVDNASPDSNELHEMSGETGSLRYMAPEVAKADMYNQKADVYSFGIILWELNSYEKPFDGMHREEFYDKVVHGGYRPELSRKFPEDLSTLIQSCWSSEPDERPNFSEIVETLKAMLAKEKGHKVDRKPKNRLALLMKSSSVKKKDRRSLTDRHSTWF